MAEWSEILMSLSNGKWNAGNSSGEGLSQFCSILRFQTGHYEYYGSWVDSWLNGVASSPNAARSDWVNQTFTGSGSVHGDGDSVSFGCCARVLVLPVHPAAVHADPDHRGRLLHARGRSTRS